MFRRILKTGFTSGLIIAADVFDPDTLKNVTDTEKKIDTSRVQQTGWDRLKRMFQTDEWGNLSKELVTITHVSGMSLFVGALYGGFIHSRVAYENFIKNNQATKFVDHMEAKKKLQDQVTTSFGKGAWKWAWRLSIFSTSFIGVSTVISVYRGESGIIDYVAAGFVSGTLYKWNMGPRGWVVGGGLGSALGLLAGCITIGLLKLSGMSMEEVRYWQYHWRENRDAYVHKGMAEYVAREKEQYSYLHDKKIGDQGKNLDSIE